MCRSGCPDDEGKCCKGCDTHFPLERFGLDPSVKSGFKARCKKCAAAYYKTDVQRAKRAAWCREEHAKYPERQENRSLKYRFGLSLADYGEILAWQGGGCGLCGAREPGGIGKFRVDHDHDCCPSQRSCGKCVRALLCIRCNAMLGVAGDDAELLRLGADYLEEHRAKRAA